MINESGFMLEALEISKQALPLCRPNPPVGCVFVKDEQVIARGYTQSIGGDHAEVTAVRDLKNQDSAVSFDGVTAYVTLEPCSFAGRTPSCAHMLIDQGVKKVVVAMLDPDPRNSGAGVDALRAAGIDVSVGLEANTVSNFLRPYLGQA